MNVLHEMTDGQIIALLSSPNQRVPPSVHRFLSEILDSDLELDEIPSFLRMLSRAEVALRDFPLDVDLTEVLTYPELGPLIGLSADLPEDVPGVTDRVPGAWDMPLKELRKHIGPAEVRYHIEQLGKQFDAENVKSLAEFEKFFRFPTNQPTDQLLVGAATQSS